MKELREWRDTVIKDWFVFGLVSFLLVSTLCIPCTVAGQQNASATAADTNAELVLLTVTVSDKNGYCVKGLRPGNFTVLSDKSPQEIKFFSQRGEPVSVVILIDRSGSMVDKPQNVNKIGLIKEALSDWLPESNKANEYLLLGFNQNASLLLDWTRDTQAVLTALDELASKPPKGQTALYDACYLGLEKAKSGAHTRRALILFTDGQDNSSQHRFDELSHFLPTTNIVIYTINILDLRPRLLSPDLILQSGRILGDLTSLSGGLAFYPKSKAELKASFGFISQELHDQYLIGFKPKDSARDGKPHNIAVKVTLPPNSPLEQKQLVVRSRKGYVVPKQ